MEDKRKVVTGKKPNSKKKSTNSNNKSIKNTKTNKKVDSKNVPKNAKMKVSTNKKNTKEKENSEIKENIVIENPITNTSDEIVNIEKDESIIKPLLEEELIETQNNDKEENNVKLENARYVNTKRSNFVFIGVLISILGIIALLISLIANRTVDADILSDTSIIAMIIISLIIEIFGAAIIINETDK